MYLMVFSALFSYGQWFELVHHHAMKPKLKQLWSRLLNVHARHRAKKLIGQVAVVTLRVQPGVIGEIRLPRPVMGKSNWAVESKHQSTLGNLVKIIEIKENTLVVERFYGE